MGLKFLLASLLSFAAVGKRPAIEDVEAFERGTVTIEIDGTPRSFPYRLHRPASASADRPLPLVVFLHGAGERGKDNVSQLRHFPERWVREPHLGARHPAFVLAVQCPDGEDWGGVVEPGADVWRAGGTDTSPAMQGVETLLRELAASPEVDPTRIYLTGLSMGGFGTWELLSRHADWFAAAVPICGGGDPRHGKVIAESGVPIWNFHGTADRDVLIRESRGVVEAIRAAGGRVGHTELPDVGHDAWSHAYGPNGAIDWMFAQRRPAAEATPAR